MAVFNFKLRTQKNVETINANLYSKKVHFAQKILR